MLAQMVLNFVGKDYFDFASFLLGFFIALLFLALFVAALFFTFKRILP